jgi:hypothetical protein
MYVNAIKTAKCEVGCRYFLSCVNCICNGLKASMHGKDNGLFLTGRKKQKSIRNIPSEPTELLLL